jgi:hypothetical protein
MRTVRNGFHEFVDGCSIDFPVAAEGMCSVGVNELRFHDRARRKEYTFLITRMRCWKVRLRLYARFAVASGAASFLRVVAPHIPSAALCLAVAEVAGVRRAVGLP